MSTEPQFDPFAGPAIVDVVPTTESQREIWTATRVSADASLAFNESVTLRLRGALDAAALQAAVVALVARHESLRATVSADGLSIVIGEVALDVPLPQHDWSAETAGVAEARLAALAAAVVDEPFDLVTGPLVRFELVRLAADDHALVITAHHVVCDGWSFGVIVTELGALYAAAARGVPNVAGALAPAPSYAEWVRTLETSEAKDAVSAAERHWLGALRDAPEPVELPADRARPAVRTYDSARVERTLPPALVTRLIKAGAQDGASLFVTMFTGFSSLLHRLSGRDDLVIGVPAALQPSVGPGLVGHLVSLLPLRVQVPNDVTFRTLLGETRRTVLDAWEHQALTFGALLAQLSLPRDIARPPLVSVCFNLERGLGAGALAFGGLRATAHTNARSRETFDLFINAVEADGAVTLECQYNTTLFDEATVTRWLEAYERLLDGAADQMTHKVAALPILTAADLAAHARAIGETLPADDVQTVHGLVERQARLTPDRIAIACDDRTITYAVLDAQAEAVAARLRRFGVGRGVRVGLCVDRTESMLAAMLGVLKAGGAYVPLDPNYPVERLAFMLEDAAIEVLVTDSVAQATTPLSARHVIRLDRPAESDGVPSGKSLGTSPAGPEDPAYVIYTSGSTGKPKGVLVPHRAAVNLLRSVIRTPGVTPNDNVLAVTTLSFDIAFAELMAPLAAGARVVLASRETAMDGARLRTLVESSHITLIDATPATYRLLLAAGWTGGDSVRVICTGEAMPLDLATTLHDCVGEVWNGYGPTETTVWSTFWRVTTPLTRVRIGSPVANTRALVLDVAGRPVPIGVAGELYLAGTGVTLGYLNRPELTESRFVPDPAVPNARMYRTGDLARLLADGTLECLGRTDDQVKVRGYRIELGEIESALLRHPDVMQAAVVAREDRPGDVRLVGYVVEGAAVADASLREHLARTLPDYMRPTTIMRVATMPLTPSGKIDRRALPAPAGHEPVSDAPFVEPRSEAEHLLAELWRDALGTGRVSVHDDFFALGGHSLLASQVLARLRRDHGVALPFRNVFEAPTIARFALLVDAARAAAAVAHAPAAPVGIPRRADATSAPLSSVQERLWLLEELDPATRLTHAHPAAWRLRGAFDVAALERALDALAVRHDALRTSFHMVDGARIQRVAKSAAVPVVQLDFSHLEPEAREAAVMQLLADAQETPFELDVAPLFHAWIVRLADDEHVLFTRQHGMVWDGWSFDVFVRELSTLYAEAARDAQLTPVALAATLPANSIAYGDFAAWQREWLSGPEMGAQVAWWREQLDGTLPVLTLPTDRPRPVTPTYRGARVSLDGDPADVEALRALARKHDTTLFMLIFAAYNALLHRWSGQDDLVVGSPVRARTQTETEDLIGPFVNTVAIRTRVRGSMPFTELLAQVRDTTLHAFSRQETPFELLGGRSPVLRALFSMQDARTRPTALGPLAVEQVHPPQPFATNDLMLWTMESSRGMHTVLNYSTELFDEATAVRFLAQLRALLRDVRRDASRPIAALDLLDDTGRAAALASLVEPAPAETVVDRIAARGARTPSAVAFVAAGQSVTHAVMQRRADAVAQAIADAPRGGAARGRRAIVLARPGAARVVGLLGALRAAVPALLVDPAQPAPYLRALLASASVIVADASGQTAVAASSATTSVPCVAIVDDADAVTLGMPRPASSDVALLLHAPDGVGGIATTPVRHDALAALLDDLGARLALTADDVLVAAGAAGADAAAVELLLPLASGAQLVVSDDADAARDPDALVDALEDGAATVAMATAGTWREVARSGWCPRAGTRLVAAAESLDAADMRPLLANGTQVLVVGGAAEAGLWTTCTPLAADAVPMPAPLGNTRLVVLDDLLRPTAINVPGTLYVAGLDDTSAEVVTVATASGTVAVRRTGRRVRRVASRAVLPVADGRWALVDAGRVSIAAVERSLRAHPAIADAAVAVHADGRGVARIVAYVVPRAGVAYTDSALRTAVRAELPTAHVPSLFVVLDRIDRIDRANLASPYAAASRADAFVAPRSPAEVLLASVWRDLLGVERVGVTDNFFALGGFSLLCFRAIDRVRRETGVRLSPRVLLLGTLEQAAVQLAAEQAAGTASPNASDDPLGTPPAASGTLVTLPNDAPPAVVAAPAPRGLDRLRGLISRAR